MTSAGRRSSKQGAKTKAKANANKTPPKAKAKAKASKTPPKAKAKAKASTPPKAKAKLQKSKRPPGLATMRTDVTNGESYGERFDRSPYEVPLMDLTEAIAVATELLDAKLARPTPAIAEEAAALAKARDRAKAVAGSESDAASVDARPFDVAMDRAWTTVVRRLQDHSELPVERHPHAADATKVYAIVQDLSILKLNYLAEFAQIGARLDVLKREGLLEDARELAGAAFVDEVLHCHAEYGKALGVMDAPRASQPADRGETRLALFEAIREYAYQVLALARAGRPKSWEQVEAALEPIAALRLRQARELRAERAIAAPPEHPPLGTA